MIPRTALRREGDEAAILEACRQPMTQGRLKHDLGISNSVLSRVLRRMAYRGLLKTRHAGFKRGAVIYYETAEV